LYFVTVNEIEYFLRSDKTDHIEITPSNIAMKTIFTSTSCSSDSGAGSGANYSVVQPALDNLAAWPEMTA
jgi:hypothetical protein